VSGAQNEDRPGRGGLWGEEVSCVMERVEIDPGKKSRNRQKEKETTCEIKIGK